MKQSNLSPTKIFGSKIWTQKGKRLFSCSKRVLLMLLYLRILLSEKLMPISLLLSSIKRKKAPLKFNQQKQVLQRRVGLLKDASESDYHNYHLFPRHTIVLVHKAHEIFQVPVTSEDVLCYWMQCGMFPFGPVLSPTSPTPPKLPPAGLKILITQAGQ